MISIGTEYRNSVKRMWNYCVWLVPIKFYIPFLCWLDCDCRSDEDKENGSEVLTFPLKRCFCGTRNVNRKTSPFGFQVNANIWNAETVIVWDD